MIRRIQEACSRLLSIFRRHKLDRDFEEELSAHIDMLAQDNQKHGMSPYEARRQAILRLGGLRATKELHRETRGLPRLENAFQASWLDFKLGARMLMKYPGLTIVGGLGMAVAIAICAAVFDGTVSFFYPTLPLDEGNRVVAIQNWDDWRNELKSIENLAAYRTIRCNLIAQGQPTEQVAIAEVSASGFRVARVPALLGRHLIEDDEREAASPVVVIGHDVWQSRFAAEPSVLGREIRLGNTVHKIVGVMPVGFAFPVDHRFWTPLKANPPDDARAPAVTVFGRLSPHATIDSAQAELTTTAQRTASSVRETQTQLRPRVLPYTALWVDANDFWQVHLLRFLVTLLVVIISVNIAALMYARTASRTNEIAVRSALGASRQRIVVQLFIEAFVFSAGAAALGIGITRVAFELVKARLWPAEGSAQLPYWMDFSLSFTTIVYVTALALLAALIAGAIPALQATGRRLQPRLGQLGGNTGMQLGKVWTLLIVAQVAFTVALLPLPIDEAWEIMKYGTAEPGFETDQFLTTTAALDSETPSNWNLELLARLKSEPAVSDVTYSLQGPGKERFGFVEVEGITQPTHEVRIGRVDIHLFDVFDVPILTGRPFHSGDSGPTASAVIVNQSFVRQILGDANPLGSRVRYAGRTRTMASNESRDRWYEIVGVVSDFPNAMSASTQARLYHAASAEQLNPMNITLRLRGVPPAVFGPQLTEIATALNPSVRLSGTRPLNEALREDQALDRLIALGLGVITLSVLLLSAAGIYAMMSFTVAQRRREIGIRTALGADRRRILGGIFAKAFTQLASGVAVGLVVAILLDVATDGEFVGGDAFFILPVVSFLMVIVGLLAAFGPARRGLRIAPTDALKEQ